MIEVFKTNINSEEQAEKTLLFLKAKFPNYEANFDLEDCDNILRIESLSGALKTREILLHLTTLNIEARIID